MNFIDYFYGICVAFYWNLKASVHICCNYIEKSGCFVKIQVYNVSYCDWTGMLEKRRQQFFCCCQAVILSHWVTVYFLFSFPFLLVCLCLFATYFIEAFSFFPLRNYSVFFDWSRQKVNGWIYMKLFPCNTWIQIH